MSSACLYISNANLHLLLSSGQRLPMQVSVSHPILSPPLSGTTVPLMARNLMEIATHAASAASASLRSGSSVPHSSVGQSAASMTEKAYVRSSKRRGQSVALHLGWNGFCVILERLLAAERATAGQERDQLLVGFVLPHPGEAGWYRALWRWRARSGSGAPRGSSAPSPVPTTR